jgi:homocysteine S-methyltransferase
MSRAELPQLDRPFLTDSGLETDLIFHHGVDLPQFAAFPLLESATGQAHLERYYLEHATVAAEHGLGFVFETPTWRANPDWGATLGYDAVALDIANRTAIELMRDLAARSDVEDHVLSGCIGPRSDGYRPASHMDADEAAAYHRPQLEAFAAAGADLATALTLTYPAEAVGVVRAAIDVGLPVVVSFTVETDGRLPNGDRLGAAVRAVDAATGSAAAYFMINCSHPDHIEPALDGGEWQARVSGLRANSSRRSHAELDEAPDLDEGDPGDLAAGYRRLGQRIGRLSVLGGCCGTDVRHLRAIAEAGR